MKAIAKIPAVISATGTRFMEANGRKAISDLFARSFNR